jgi:hypothetical protein
MVDIWTMRRFWEKLLLNPFLFGPLEIIPKVFVLTYGTPCIYVVCTDVFWPPENDPFHAQALCDPFETTFIIFVKLFL